MLTHPFNQGKGGALKTGYLYLIFTGFCLLFGIITLTIGSLVRGILDIYGTTNQKVTLYLIAGIVFLAAGIGSYILRGLVRYRSRTKQI